MTDHEAAQRQLLGGMFGLAEPLVIRPRATSIFLSDHAVRFVNATSAMTFLAKRLRPGRVWLPSYLCDAVVVAFRRAESRIRFYDVDDRLSTPSLTWTMKVEKGDLVVLIDYFGFPCDRALVDAARSRGAWTLEDASQALLSTHVGGHADFVVFSPRKFVGVPDGGILVSRCAVDLQPASLTPVPAVWWLKALAAAQGRRDFDNGASDDGWFARYQLVERTRPVGPYAMSELSRFLLERSFDYRAIARQRIANYRRLSGALADMALFPELPRGVVPLGFPIRLSHRRRVLQSLFKAHVYPPVHWPLRGVVPRRFEHSHRLSETVLTVPCDQRYGRSDMDRVAALLRRAVRAVVQRRRPR